MQYIDILNNFWNDIIHRDGYKLHYGYVYLALVDLVNKNRWKVTPATKEQMTAKTRCSNSMYYESLLWLEGENLIEYKAGNNRIKLPTLKLCANSFHGSIVVVCILTL